MLGLGLSFGVLAQNNSRPGWVPLGAAWAADFVGDRYWIRSEASGIDSAIATGKATFARASSGLYLNAAAAWSNFPSGALRRGDVGALIEPAGTNLLPNSTMQGANVSTNTPPTGWVVNSSVFGLSRTIVGTGSIGGLPYIDIRYAGTLTSTGGVNAIALAPSLSATAGGRYTHSDYLAIVAGSFGATTATVNMQTLASNGTTTVDNFSGSEIFAGLGSALGRRSVSAVAGASAAFIVPRLRVTFGTAGTAVDFTLRIAAPQLELSAVATSPILTSGTAATRNADALVLKPAGGTYNVTCTFDDNSTQVLAGQVITESGWAVPTNLNRPNIKSISGATA